MKKMIRRHPHVFGNVDASTSGEVLDIWDNVKLSERNASEESADARPEGLLDSVPVSFPALMQASKISRKAVSAGFEWDTVDDVWDKVEEEIAEFKQACKEQDAHAMELEFGDVLFTLVNVARKVKVDPENALRATCRKFRDRWAFMEGAAWAQGKHIEDLSMDELQELWDQAKTQARNAVNTAAEEGATVSAVSQDANAPSVMANKPITTTQQGETNHD